MGHSPQEGLDPARWEPLFGEADAAIVYPGRRLVNDMGHIGCGVTAKSHNCCNIAISPGFVNWRQTLNGFSRLDTTNVPLTK